MSVYKIFPNKDNFISSQYPNANFGRDEILDIAADSNNKTRAIIQFDQEEITTIINQITGSYQTNLKLYIANSSNIPSQYNIDIHPLSQSWIMGTGRSGDEPFTSNGSCWNYRDINNTSSLWAGGEYINYGISQSFDYPNVKDINCNITSIISDWYNNTLPNNGILLKHTDTNENSSSLISTQFFSIDTHTIYPPCLEIKWDDSIYSSSLLEVTNNEFYTRINNIHNEYNIKEKHTFKIQSRDLYPIRNFQTSSVYLNTKILPENSYWSIKDVKTEEIIIDFDPIGTKLSANDDGNYFTVDFNGLQPERYYQLLIKTEVNNDVIIIDDKNNYFKLVR